MRLLFHRSWPRAALLLLALLRVLKIVRPEQEIQSVESSRATSGDASVDLLEKGESDWFFYRKLKRKRSTGKRTRSTGGNKPQCAAKPACSHLAGDCCPTSSGVFLACCFQSPPPVKPPTKKPVTRPTTRPVLQPRPTRQPTNNGAPGAGAMCSATPACSHLAGDCCPTAGGVFLVCCFQSPPPVRPPSKKPIATPTRKPISRRPTKRPAQGQPRTPKPSIQPTMVVGREQCKFHPVCRDDFGLVGHCCPTLQGVYLECCSGGQGSPTSANTAKPTLVMKRPMMMTMPCAMHNKKCRNPAHCCGTLNCVGSPPRHKKCVL